MLKSLSKLLFEEEIIEEEEDLEEELPPVKKEVKVNKNPQDVMREKVQLPPVQPPVQEVVQPEVKETTVRHISLDVEEIQEAPKKRKIDPEILTNKSTTYEFNPVISPMFGVDEKDLDAVVPTSPVKVKKMKNDSKIGTIISPMYGMAKSDDDEPELDIHPMAKRSHHEPEEDLGPIMTLDDLLDNKVQEEAEKPVVFDAPKPTKTYVAGSNLSLFDDEFDKD